jgi:serine/threonine-protein kinase
MIGKKLNHYEITSQLGKGGMGEVYQAKDQKLGRDVAIKVLPGEFAKDSDRVARFQREAKVLASLNHPNIAAIYGLEEYGGTNFLVLELVEGDTLADRIKAGPVPVEEALKLALQIAEALEAAHEKGVIHRDLKPANIKVTPDGKVKVLDFGLAKAFAGEQAELNLSNSPTLSNAATQQGVILGTAGYMSPEQAKGKTVDKRADIWAFGVVLFEMLTGRQLFSGETVSETLAAVLMREPDFSKLPRNLHPKIIEALERCLDKEARNRYGVISDARVDIQKALADPSGLLVQPITTLEPRRKLRTILPWAAATLVLGLIIAAVTVWNLKKAEPRQVMRFEYDLPEGQQLSYTMGSALAIAPDGKQFVYSTTKGLCLRPVDELTAKLIPGTEGDTQQPFFSPDGKWVGYWSSGDKKLKKISVSGGAPVTLCDVTNLASARWYENNTIVYGQIPGDIMRISANGGTPESLVKAESGVYLEHPQVLPDGKSVLFTRAPAPRKIMVQSLRSGVRKELFPGDAATYLPTGQLVFTLKDDAFGIAFDLDKLEVTGEPAPLVEGVHFGGLSDSGTLVYVPGTASSTAATRTLVWVNREGKEEPLAAPPNAYKHPKISPDGTRITLTVGGTGDSDIWIWDLVHKTMTRLTFDKNRNFQSIWTPDGKQIVYFSSREGTYGSVYWKAADGTLEDEKLASGTDRYIMPWSWSRDGKALVIQENFAFKYDIGMLSMEGNRARKPLLQHEKYSVFQPKISPDGRWITYTSNESGQYEVYVRPFPDVNKGKWQVSTSGGDSPLWSPNGREIFYRNGDSVMAVSVKTAPTFSLETPSALFRETYVSSVLQASNPDFATWDISPDGKRFLMMKEAGSGAGGGPLKINIVLNWTEELKQRVQIK